MGGCCSAGLGGFGRSLCAGPTPDAAAGSHRRFPSTRMIQAGSSLPLGRKSPARITEQRSGMALFLPPQPPVLDAAQRRPGAGRAVGRCGAERG